MSDINDLAARSERLFDAVANVLLGSVEAGVERLEQAGELARLQGRMAVFGATLDAIDAQRQPLIEKIERGTSGAMKMLLHKQVEMLNAQEASVLARAGISTEVVAEAQKTLEASAGDTPGTPGTVAVKSHRRRKPGADEILLTNGHPVEN